MFSYLTLGNFCLIEIPSNLYASFYKIIPVLNLGINDEKVMAFARAPSGASTAIATWYFFPDNDYFLSESLLYYIIILLIKMFISLNNRYILHFERQEIYRTCYDL